MVPALHCLAGHGHSLRSAKLELAQGAAPGTLRGVRSIAKSGARFGKVRPPPVLFSFFSWFGASVSAPTNLPNSSLRDHGSHGESAAAGVAPCRAGRQSRAMWHLKDTPGAHCSAYKPCRSDQYIELLIGMKI